MDSTIQALEEQLKSATTPTQQIDALNRLAWAIRHQAPQRALTLSQTAHKNAITNPFQNEPYQRGVADSLRNLASINYHLAEYGQALNEAFEALKHYQILAYQAELPNVLAIIGAIYWRLGNYSDAVIYLLDGLDIAKQLQDHTAQAEALNNLGIVYDVSGDYSEALNSYTQCLQLHKKKNNENGQAIVLSNLAMLYAKLKDYQRALNTAHESLQLAQKLNNNQLSVSILGTIGSIYVEIARYDEALNYFLQSLESARQLGAKFIEMDTLRNMGNLYLQQNQLNRAKTTLNQAVALAKIIEARQELAQCYQLLSQLYQKQNQFETALSYYQQYHALERFVFNEEANDKLKNFQLLYRIEQTKKEAEIYQLKNVKLRKEIEDREKIQLDLLEATEKAEQRANEMTALAEIGREISATLTLSHLLEKIANWAKQLLEAIEVAIYLKDDDTNIFRAIVSIGDYAEVVKATEFKRGEGLPGWVVEHNIAEFANQPTYNQEKEGFPKHNDTQKLLDLAHYPILIAPLSLNREVIGVIIAWRGINNSDLFELSDLMFLVGLSRQAAIAIQNARLFSEAQDAKEKAELANQAKNRFLATVSHELRTPLNGILGYAQILLIDSTINEKQRDGLNIIQQSGEHLLMLINDVLDIAKIETGKINLEQTDFNLATFLEDIVEVIQVRANIKGVEFRFIFDKLPYTVQGDEKRLRQVLINLLGNAVKFTDEGYVMLTVSSPPDQNIIRFAVEDTGIGIATEDLKTIFQPFQQIGHQGRMTHGTGLGLTICQNLIELMGGMLQVRSQKADPNRSDNGSLFWFDLPLKWDYQPVKDYSRHQNRKTEPDSITIYKPPPLEILYQLLEALKIGDVGELQAQSHKIKALDDAYIPFATRLYQLSKTFQLKDIRQLVEQHLPESNK